MADAQPQEQEQQPAPTSEVEGTAAPSPAGADKAKPKKSKGGDPHHKQGEGPEVKAKGDADTKPEVVKPGLAAVQALQGTGDGQAGAVVKIIHEHPEERDDIMKWLQQHRGNTFVQDVTKHLGQIERALPQGVDLKSVRGSVMIPGKRKLSGDWKAAVSTREATQVTVEVTHTGVQLYMSPPLFVDAQWPLQNAELSGASIDFKTGKAHANVRDGHGLGSGMWSIKDNVAEKITGMLEKGIQGSPLAQPGYDPTQDANLQGTLQSVETHFQALFAGDANEDKKKDSKAPIDANEVNNVSAGGTVTLKEGGKFMQDGTGLQIDPGSDVSLDAIGAGNVKDVSSAGSAQGAAEQAKLTSLRLGASGLTVMTGGKPIAKISSMEVLPGGAVKIDQMELLGKAQKAQAGEAGLSLLVGLLALYAHDPAANGALQNAQDPKLVDGVSRKLMEDTFSQQVKKMVLQYRTAVPGMDIAKLLGIG